MAVIACGGLPAKLGAAMRWRRRSRITSEAGKKNTGWGGGFRLENWGNFHIAIDSRWVIEIDDLA